MRSNIILIGFMGAGKTTLGKKLAHEVGMNFIDIDDEIELETGLTVFEIVERYGIDHFRELETEYLILNEFENNVIATGGGLPCFNNNMEKLNLLGMTCYLKVDDDELVKRLNDDNTSRPLIRDFNTLDELKRFVNEKVQEREEYYLNADFTILNNTKDSDLVLNDIITKFDKYPKL